MVRAVRPVPVVPRTAASKRRFDSGTDANDTGPPPPPPPPGRPGIAIVGGGATMSSPSYKAVMATGEAPGSNGVASSPKYKLHGGVIGTTQPK